MKMLEQLPVLLLPWFAEHRRDLPWRRDREPYHVWLSEIMLQQTRVEAVRSYYLRFLERLPDIAALASAPEDVLLKLWEGLGYYSRVRNLQKAAQCVMEQHDGEFPQELSAIRALPGIGDYTAGAIASICFEAPTAAVDGNVLRVILRLTVCADSPADVRVRRRIGEELSAVYPAGHCGDFTQALMELGATVCLPNGAPQCGACPLRALCEAHAQGTELQFPTKPPKKPRRIEQRTVFVLQCGDRLAVCKRPSHGLLAGLWQLPDVPGKLETAEALRQAEQWGVHPTGILKTAERTHIFTHVQWDLRGVWLTCAAEAPQFTWADEDALRHEIGLPTAYRQFLDLHAE